MTQLLRELFELEEDYRFDAPTQRRGLNLLLESQQAAAWVAEYGGVVVGMVTVQLVVSTAEGGASGQIEDLVVTASHRWCGIGNRLLKTVVRWSVEQGVTRLQLLVDRRNRAALAFYRNQEWRPTNMIALRYLG